MPQDSPQNRKTNANPYRTISASERRARRQAREAGKVRVPTGDGVSASPRSVERVKAKTEAALPQELVNELLANPTKVVTEEDLHRDYAYVIADLRNMAVLAGALVVVLFTIGFLLPR